MPAHAAAPAPQTLEITQAGEAVAALIGLGIAEPVGRRAVEAVAARQGGAADLPALIKAALQEIGR